MKEVLSCLANNVISGYKLGEIWRSPDEPSWNVSSALRLEVGENGLCLMVIEKSSSNEHASWWSKSNGYDCSEFDGSYEYLGKAIHCDPVAIAKRSTDVEEAARLILGSVFAENGKLQTPAKGEMERYAKPIRKKFENFLDEMGAVIMFHTLSEGSSMIEIDDETRIVFSESRCGIMISFQDFFPLGLSGVGEKRDNRRHYYVCESHFKVCTTGYDPEWDERYGGESIGLRRLRELVAKKNALFLMVH